MADLDTFLPDNCGYNKIFKHQWKTNTNAIPLSSVNHIRDLIKGKFGWHFIPHKNMDYSREDWYKDQTLVITFENKLDLILSKLTTTL
jgi:predicted molibdopterin-dependent oxidoreductase YjgC